MPKMLRGEVLSSKKYQSLTGHLEEKIEGTKKAFEKDKEN